LTDLDFMECTSAAAGQGDCAAHGKIVHIGRNGATVLQTSPEAAPEVVWCGNAAAAVGLLWKDKSGYVKLYGPAGKSALVSFSTTGTMVNQDWILPPPECTEDAWRGRAVLRCAALNDYAVVLDSLPDDVNPEQARRALVGPGLGAKLAVVVRPPDGAAHVAFYNADGTHGAAPMTGLATLAIIARFSPLMASFISDGTVTYQTKAGSITAPLPTVYVEPGGSMTIPMPTVEVLLSPFAGRRAQ
jgi:hypothetical protein